MKFIPPGAMVALRQLVIVLRNVRFQFYTGGRNAAIAGAHEWPLSGGLFPCILMPVYKQGSPHNQPWQRLIKSTSHRQGSSIM